jgi:hypothetical protein
MIPLRKENVMELLDLGVDLILQETCITCGPAVARMVHGAGARLESEIDIFSLVVDFMRIQPNQCFETSPEALAEVLQSVTGDSFRVVRHGSVEEANKLIANVLIDHRTPVPVLVGDCSHWIVASGLVYLEDLGTIQLATFIIDDPYNPCITCSSGGVLTPLCVAGRFSSHFVDKVPAAEWRQSWLTGCDCTPPKEFICIVPSRASEGTREVIDLVEEDPGPDFDRPIVIGDLPDCLESAKIRYSLNVHPAFARSLEGARVLDAREVQRNEGTYFLTEIGQPGAVTALFLFNSKNGGLMGARALKSPIDKFLPTPIHELQQTLRAWRNRNNVGLLLEESLTEEVPFSWVPSREFRSPYFPFTVLGDGIDRVYLGLNGAIYKNLQKAKA